MIYEESMSRRFELIRTSDGSPSLQFWDPNGTAEKMHHAGGALGETLFIYAPAVEYVFANKLPFRFVVGGLGLGYLEIMIAVLARKHKAPLSDVFLCSFESETLFRESFLRWVKTGEDYYVDEEKSAVRSKITSSFLEQLRVDASEADIRSDLNKLYLNENKVCLNGVWEIKGDIRDAKKVHGSAILYDMYSGTSDPDLWTEGFLLDLIERLAGSECVFATYASKGALTRALRKLNFEVDLRQGYLGKRHSTWAIRRH